LKRNKKSPKKLKSCRAHHLKKIGATTTRAKTKERSDRGSRLKENEETRSREVNTKKGGKSKPKKRAKRRIMRGGGTKKIGNDGRKRCTKTMDWGPQKKSNRIKGKKARGGQDF